MAETPNTQVADELAPGLTPEQQVYVLHRIVARLTAERDAAKEQSANLMAEAIHMLKKLDAGTLHVLYCNGDHNARVGEEGKICNCTLGKEIKHLRADRDALTQHLKEARAEIARLTEVIGKG